MCGKASRPEQNERLYNRSEPAVLIVKCKWRHLTNLEKTKPAETAILRGPDHNRSEKARSAGCLDSEMQRASSRRQLEEDKAGSVSVLAL